MICSHEEFIKDGDGFLDGDENASDNNDDESLQPDRSLNTTLKNVENFKKN